jgi:predicted amidophosphoribosyltransferase
MLNEGAAKETILLEKEIEEEIGRRRTKISQKTEIPVVSPNVRCPSCGTENKEEDGFCAHCGEALGNACEICGNISPLDARFCNNCGVELKHFCPQCRADLQEGDKFCSSCGMAVSVTEENDR